MTEIEIQTFSEPELLIKLPHNDPKILIQFYRNNEIIGKFYFNDQGVMDFEGETTESAKVFIEAVMLSLKQQRKTQHETTEKPE